MSAVKPSSEEAVAKALASQSDQTVAEIAAATGRARSTVGMALAALERGGVARRTRGGRADHSPLPDRWSIGTGGETSRPDPPAGRLRRGQLDELVLDYLDAHANDGPVGATAVAKALGRSAGAVGNCLTRLAGAGRVRQVGATPRRYRGATPRSSKRGRARGSRKEES
jgi:predicted transcriptional regulator